jgi:hypothetical protein
MLTVALTGRVFSQASLRRATLNTLRQLLLTRLRQPEIVERRRNEWRMNRSRRLNMVVVAIGRRRPPLAIKALTCGAASAQRLRASANADRPSDLSRGRYASQKGMLTRTLIHDGFVKRVRCFVLVRPEHPNPINAGVWWDKDGNKEGCARSAPPRRRSGLRARNCFLATDHMRQSR